MAEAPNPTTRERRGRLTRYATTPDRSMTSYNGSESTATDRAIQSIPSGAKRAAAFIARPATNGGRNSGHSCGAVGVKGEEYPTVFPPPAFVIIWATGCAWDSRQAFFSASVTGTRAYGIV